MLSNNKAHRSESTIIDKINKENITLILYVMSMLRSVLKNEKRDLNLTSRINFNCEHLFELTEFTRDPNMHLNSEFFKRKNTKSSILQKYRILYQICLFLKLLFSVRK